ncbi:Adenylate cyclase [Tetrabaena socialis]|uniref:Adenylate cyclase n=1 Tax=Tetrabaena socialis TaxID=47790 RepID=A0A2J8AIK9_9CHLO|nr:Adenylate cyclase [Tetrabaena socialis]|eukprot:PNH12354.1 Adenylate cyclase [Tetrabaena socialis]
MRAARTAGTGLIGGHLAAVLSSVLVVVAVAAAALAVVLLLRRGRRRDMLGRVRAPRAGPDTTLVVSDIQNSTRLWEELSVATMDSALKLHHATIRAVLAEHDGYESATEGDSFIVAFASPANACDFAAAVQRMDPVAPPEAAAAAAAGGECSARRTMDLEAAGVAEALGGLAVVSWMRYPAWFNGLFTAAFRDMSKRPGDFGLSADVVVVQPTSLPPLAAITSAGTMRDLAASPQYAFAITTSDLSGFSSLAAWSRLRSVPSEERVCVNESDPRGLLRPRTNLLMLYRPDALRALVAAGRLAEADAPDDWEELLVVLQAHAAHVAETKASGGSAAAAGFPTHGLCITADPDCGRLGDVLAAVAASVVQTDGTPQGYVYDISLPGARAAAASSLVGGVGWRHAAELLRAMLQYNAPPVPGPDGGRECTMLSSHFVSGDCLATFEWDGAWSMLGREPALVRPGVLAAAPLPGSRRVQDRRAGSTTQGQLVPCTWELCAASANHDLLYGASLADGGNVAASAAAAAQRMDPVAPPEAAAAAAVECECSARRTMDLEAAGVAEALGVLAGLGAVWKEGAPVNRAPYSVIGGKVMNRAARIAGTAAAGQVLASGAVWRAAEQDGSGGGVVGLSLGRLPLKGITAPVEVVLCTRGG